MRNKKPKILFVGNRPFETDYAGVWRGHCKTREGAIIAAIKHIVRDGYFKCTITDRRTEEIIARVTISSDRKRAIVTAYEPMEKV